MKAADIKTPSDLEAWLKDHAVYAAVSIGHRSAARVMPLLWYSATKTNEVSSEVLLRALQALMYSSNWAIHADPYFGESFGRNTQVLDAQDFPPEGGPYDGVALAALLSISSPSSDIVTNVVRCLGLARELEAEVFAEEVNDAAFYERTGSLEGLPLWRGGITSKVDRAWSGIPKMPPTIREDRPDYQSFWVPWYQGLIDGEPAFPEALTRSVALIEPEDWKKGDVHINNVVIPSLMNEHMPPLLEAAPVDFSFDALARVMRMIGIDNDTAHLRDPVVVSSFRDDCSELEDTLQDFRDFAHALGGGNHAAVLAMAVDKVLKELRRTGDETHLRARYLVGLCYDLETFSKEEKARADLGEGLAAKLDRGIDLLQMVTRKHLAPAYTALVPLAQLSLDQVDQDQVVSLYDDMIGWLEHLPIEGMVDLDKEGLSVFRDMVRETKEFRAAIAEASSEEFRTILKDRFAFSAGSTGLALGRFIQRSYEAAGAGGKAADAAIKNFERARSLRDIVNAVHAALTGGTS